MVEENKEPTLEQLFPYAPVSNIACADIYHRISNLPLYFRLQLCKEMNCSSSSYHRMIHSEANYTKVSDHFVKTSVTILQRHIDYIQKWWNSDAVIGRSNPISKIATGSFEEFTDAYSVREFEERLWDLLCAIIASNDADKWSGVVRSNFLFLSKHLTRVFRSIYGLSLHCLTIEDQQYHEYVEDIKDFCDNYDAKYVKDLLQQYLPIVVSSDPEFKLLPIFKQLIRVTQIILKMKNHKKKEKIEMPFSLQECVRRIDDFTSSMDAKNAEELTWSYLNRIMESSEQNKWSSNDYSRFFLFSQDLVQAITNMYNVKPLLIKIAVADQKIKITSADYQLTIEKLSDALGTEEVTRILNEKISFLLLEHTLQTVNFDRAEFCFATGEFIRFIQSIMCLKETAFEVD